MGLPSFCFNLFGDNWSSAFFGALTSVGALFVFTENRLKGEIKMIKRTLLTICFVLVMIFTCSCFFFNNDNGNNKDTNTSNTDNNITDDTNNNVTDDNQNNQDEVCTHVEVTDAAVAPTCTDTGLTEGKHCTLCNTVTVAQETVKALGHTQVIDNAVAATCTKDGLTAGSHCTVCNEVIIAQEIIPAAHTFGEWSATREANCFYPGEESRSCSVCEQTDAREVDHLEHSFVMNEETQLYYCELCDARIFEGHMYAIIDGGNYTWYEAYEVAEELGGHLVTITSAREQTIITNLMETAVSELYWTGGIKSTNGWKWITGEKFSYTNWQTNQPDNTGSKEWVINVFSAKHSTAGVWNDISAIGNLNYSHGFICEWELDLACDEHIFTEWETITQETCFCDGERWRICTHCGYEETEVLPQLEHSFIFTETTGMTTCEHCGAGLYNGHIYLISSVTVSSWFDAYTRCEELGGHLITITSEDEQTYIQSYMSSKSFTSRVWIGAYSDGNKWQWVTDEEFEYTNWLPGEPNNSVNGTEFFGEMNYTQIGKWNDLALFYTIYFICEWEVSE